MSHTTITLPRYDYARLSSSRPGKAAAQAAMAALEGGRLPQVSTTAKGQCERVGVYLNAIADAKLRKAHKQGFETLTFAEFVSGLVVATLRGKTPSRQGKQPARDTTTVETEATAQLREAGRRPRPEQPILLAAMRASLKRGRILMGEAATGAGKSLVIAAAAVECARDGKETVVIAAPTFAILGQLLTEYRRFGKKKKLPPYTAVLGRQEFVSIRRLEALLEDDDVDDVEAAQRWLDAGGKGNNPFGANWLLGDLAEAAPRFPAELVAMTHEEPDADPGHQAYRALLDGAQNAKVVFVTHAMLAIDVLHRLSATYDASVTKKDRKAISKLRESLGHKPLPAFFYDNVFRASREPQDAGILPAYQVLFVDEAHQLEQAFASIRSETLSAHSLVVSVRQLVRQRLVGDSTLTKLERAFRELVELGKQVSADLVIDPRHSRMADRGPRERAAVMLVRALSRTVSELTERCRGSRLPKGEKAKRKALLAFDDIRAANKVLKLTLRTNVGATEFQHAVLSFSPTYRYPRIDVGPKSVARDLDYCWRRLRAGCLISATLYVPINHTEVSPHYMRDVLAIPLDRTDTMRPLWPRWAYEPVTLHLPDQVPAPIDGIDRLWLEPLSQHVRKKLTADQAVAFRNAWYEGVASELLRIARKTTRGVLVLLPSYTDMRALRERLNTRLAPKRLIVSEKGVHFRVSRDRYVAGAADGSRPIWLATGTAWQGLDVPISDLVVPRIPFGSNQSSTHKHRQARSSAGWASQIRRLDAAIKTKQAIGRLVRSPKTAPCHLYILDARIHIPAMRGLMTPILALLTSYDHPKKLRPI